MTSYKVVKKIKDFVEEFKNRKEKELQETMIDKLNGQYINKAMKEKFAKKTTSVEKMNNLVK